MRKMLFLLCVAVLVLPVSYSYGFSSKGEDCSKCHTLSKDEAAALLKDFIPNVKVLDVLVGPMKGVWEVDIESGGKKGPVYVGFSKNHLIAGQIFAIKDKKNLTQDRVGEINKVDVSLIPLDDAVVMGDRNAKYRIVVFDDPE